MKNFDLQTLHAELIRVSDWVKFADKKTAFLSAYYTIAFAFFVVHKNDILAIFTNPCSAENLFWVLVCFGAVVSFLFGVFHLFTAVFPNLNNTVTNDSLFYFGHVANMKYVEYCKKMKELTEEEVKEQIAEQIHENSIIARLKMESVKKSSIAIFLTAFLLGIFAIFG